jgi:hypothetical protein
MHWKELMINFVVSLAAIVPPHHVWLPGINFELWLTEVQKDFQILQRSVLTSSPSRGVTEHRVFWNNSKVL